MKFLVCMTLFSLPVSRTEENPRIYKMLLRINPESDRYRERIAFCNER